jgi:hypothetical protein
MNDHTVFVCYFIVYVCYSLLCAYELFLLFIVFLLILSTLVSYCFDLTAYCNPAVIMTSSIFSPVSADNGSVNLYVYIYLCIYVCMYTESLKNIPHKLCTVI